MGFDGERAVSARLGLRSATGDTAGPMKGTCSIDLTPPNTLEYKRNRIEDGHIARSGDDEKKDLYGCDPIWLERLKRFRTVGYVGRQVIQRHNCDNAR
jgi:hypothetical protein